MLNGKLILNILGILTMINGLFMLLCLPVSIYYADGSAIPIILSAAIAINLGALAWYLTRDFDKSLRNRDGYLIVTLGWLVMSVTGCLPFIISRTIPDFSSALFETISGYTTTGSSMLNDIEALPQGILFWRGMTQWIGGMGIIVLTVAILPILGVGGMQLFMAESPGPSATKLHPRITETAKRLWLIYVGLTILESIMLSFAGMSVYEAISHSMTTVSTGGFSTRNTSIAAFDSDAIHYIITFFMFCGGVNFTLFYFFLKFRWKSVWNNEEFKYYIAVVVIATLITSLVVSFQHPGDLHTSIRDSLFQVVSIVTTTGFATADYTTWGSFVTLIFFIMMFFGASAGSTAGGVKLVRHIIMVKNGVFELKRLLHPSAIIPVRLNGRAVGQKITYNILAFFFIYLTVFLLGTILMTFFGKDLLTAAGASISSLGNIGPGIGDVGPSHNFSNFSSPAKIILAIQMLMGRLEMFTVLILFTPFFWRKA